MGNNFGRFEGVKVTPTTDDANAVITVNGAVVASGTESALIPIKQEGDQITIVVRKDGESQVYALTASANDPIIVPVGASVGSEYSPPQKAANLINNSGMSGTTSLQDTHDSQSSATTMWHTANNPGDKAWAKVDLGKIYPLDEMWIWNMNQEKYSNRGLKNVKIEYSTDDSTWSELLPPVDMVFKEGVAAGYPFQFAMANGVAGLKATNLNDGKNSPVSFGGADVRYVRITANPIAGVGSWGSTYFGLSELRFTSKLVLTELIPVENITISAQG